MSKKNKEDWGEAITLYNEDNPKIKKLFDLYKKNKQFARIVFMSNERSSYYQYRLIVFYKSNRDYNIVLFRKCFGVSVTNKIYSNEKRVASLVYKNCKFHLIENYSTKKIMQPSLRSIQDAFTRDNMGGNPNNMFGNPQLETNVNFYILIKTWLITKIGWFRMLDEYPILNNLTINIIKNYKLYSYKKALSHLYGVPYPTASFLHGMTNPKYWGAFKSYLPFMVNVENIQNGDLLSDGNSHIFFDTLRMAKILNKKVNCSWSKKRLTKEHDDYSLEITTILFTEDNQKLNIKQHFIDFGKKYNYPIFTDTKGLAGEGMKRKHCVATYANTVNQGGSGIYTVKEHTLELGRNSGGLYIKQFRGFRNTPAPIDIRENVEKNLKEFNKIDASIFEEEFNECLDDMPF